MYGRAYQEWVERDDEARAIRVFCQNARLEQIRATALQIGVPTKAMTATFLEACSRADAFKTEPTMMFMPAFSTAAEIEAAKELVMPKHPTKRKPRGK